MKDFTSKFRDTSRTFLHRFRSQGETTGGGIALEEDLGFLYRSVVLLSCLFYLTSTTSPATRDSARPSSNWIFSAPLDSTAVVVASASPVAVTTRTRLPWAKVDAASQRSVMALLPLFSNSW